MKNIIIAIACLLTFATSYAQDAKPTKQETMDWIAGKMKQYLIAPRIFQTYSEGVFTYKIDNPFDDGSYGGYNIISIDLNKITNYGLETTFKGYVDEIQGAKILIRKTYDEKNKYIETAFESSVKMINLKDSNSIFDFMAEKCLNNCYEDCRLRKALDVLLKFNISSNETF
jgi:hypothetical protein